MDKHYWELIIKESDEKTERMRVPNGWLYRTRTYSFNSQNMAMVFVPDEPTPVKIERPFVQNSREMVIEARKRALAKWEK